MLIAAPLAGRVLIIDDVISAEPRCASPSQSSRQPARSRPGVVIALTAWNAAAAKPGSPQYRKWRGIMEYWYFASPRLTT